jgi:hypothetical protein
VRLGAHRRTCPAWKAESFGECAAAIDQLFDIASETTPEDAAPAPLMPIIKLLSRLARCPAPPDPAAQGTAAAAAAAAASAGTAAAAGKEKEQEKEKEKEKEKDVWALFALMAPPELKPHLEQVPSSHPPAAPAAPGRPLL